MLKILKSKSLNKTYWNETYLNESTNISNISTNGIC